jgi:hypothetical protein
MDNQAFQRLREFLQEQRRKGGSWEAEAEKINTQNPDARYAKIDRRTLTKIAKGRIGEVQIRFAQLQALDRYIWLETGRPLFSRNITLPSQIAEAVHVNFLVPTRWVPEVGDDVVASKDLRAVTRLMRTRIGRSKVAIKAIEPSQSWDGDAVEIATAANIGIGAPIVSVGSEFLMASAIGVTPHTGANPADLPYFIVGRDSDVDRMSSAFVYKLTDAAFAVPEIEPLLVPDQRALVVNRRCYQSSAYEDYALLLATRHPQTGLVQAVLCGLRGDSTHQLSRILQAHEYPLSLPPLANDKSVPPVLTMIFKFNYVPVTEKHDRRARAFKSVAAVGQMKYVRRINDGWEFYGRE